LGFIVGWVGGFGEGTPPEGLGSERSGAVLRNYPHSKKDVQ